MILQTKNLRKSFKKKEALRGVNVEVKPGEIFGLVGPDGAGKTTFFRTILGLYLPTSGSFEILGESNPEKAKSKIGYVPQQFSLNQNMTVWENLTLFGTLYGVPEDTFLERANQLLEMVWMKQFKDRLAGNLSGGMKQKLALAAGLLHRPDLLILDEPTTGVDPVSRREFWQLLYRLNREGLTLMVSTPYMDEVELCHRLSFFYEGQVRATGSPAELLTLYPYQILGLNTPNVRSRFLELQKIPALDSYLQGEDFHVILSKDNLKEDQQKVEEYLQQIGITEYTLKPINPTLEDLFGTLSNNEGSEANDSSN
jgi:ABC-2 type transport system ATP-binding protein